MLLLTQCYPLLYRWHFKTVRGRKVDAQRSLTELLTSFNKGVYPPPGKLTSAEHLRNWLVGYVKTNCSEITLWLWGYSRESPNTSCREYSVKATHTQAIYAYYSKAYKKLSARTVHHQHRVLSEALKYAVRQGYLGRNPCELVDPPKPQKKAMRTLTPEELENLLEVVSSNQFYPLIYTTVSTGLRQAELLGLRWRDIDFESESILVSRTLHKMRGVIEFKEAKTESIVNAVLAWRPSWLCS